MTDLSRTSRTLGDHQCGCVLDNEQAPPNGTTNPSITKAIHMVADCRTEADKIALSPDIPGLAMKHHVFIDIPSIITAAGINRWER